MRAGGEPPTPPDTPGADALCDALGGATLKRWTEGTHRARTPEDTLGTAAPLLQRCGITRVADVTGLDRIGIPVAMAVRPNGRTLSVFQGKGATRDAARVSGVMEAVEAHFAESHRLEVVVADVATIATSRPAVDPHRLPRRACGRWSPETPLPWVEGFDLLDGGRAWVPLERVVLDHTLPRAAGMGLLAQDSNGLASGNTLAEALLHALLELVERDACAIAAATQTPSRVIDGRWFEDPLADELASRCAAVGMSLELADLTTDAGIPVVEAVLAEHAPGPLPALPPVRGYGCHLDSRVAVSRAITEAAQARLTCIAGSRDDLSSASYRRRGGGPAWWRRRAARGARRVALPQGVAGTTIEDDVRTVLGALADLGVDCVIAVDLSPPERTVGIVRVVVPALEGYSGWRGYTPGPRALAAAARS